MRTICPKHVKYKVSAEFAQKLAATWAWLAYREVADKVSYCRKAQ
jgi:hypothetical protein